MASAPDLFQPGPFVVRTRCTADALHIALVGDVDARSRDALLTTITSNVAGRDTVTFDLTCVDFVDSTALTALIHARKALDPAHGQVIIVNPPAMLPRLLDISGLSDSFTVVPGARVAG